MHFHMQVYFEEKCYSLLHIRSLPLNARENKGIHPDSGKGDARRDPLKKSAGGVGEEKCQSILTCHLNRIIILIFYYFLLFIVNFAYTSTTE